jgi:hypothetical protein
MYEKVSGAFLFIAWYSIHIGTTCKSYVSYIFFKKKLYVSCMA